MLEGLLDLIFPPKCAGCDLQGLLLCDRCAQAVARIDQASACRRCGAPPDVSATTCAECAGRRFAFSAARCASLLAPPVSRAVVLLKDGGERRYAPVLASLLAETAGAWLDPDDVLVPVPASPAAVRRRGFDHAADIARSLGGLTGCEVRGLLLATGGADQRALTREERFANRAGAFRMAEPSGLAPAQASPARVVLVDDVFTTGATMDAAARTLRASGASDVRALAVARAVRRA